ncbi:MAG: hypothetical protein PVI73_14475 [Syntrophobacterales bacterium]|jgi:hypothetical protein
MAPVPPDPRIERLKQIPNENFILMVQIVFGLALEQALPCLTGGKVVKPRQAAVRTDPRTARTIIEKFKGGLKTRPLVDRKTGKIIGEITEDGQKVIRYPHVDRPTPIRHWNLENKKTGLNVHVIVE